MRKIAVTRVTHRCRLIEVGSHFGAKTGREGFEPSDEVNPRHPLSRRALSATQPPPREVSARV